MAFFGSTTPRALRESGDIELRFGIEQQPLRAHRQFLSLASPTVLGPMINAEDLIESTWYLDTFFSAMPVLHKYNFSTLLKHAAGLVESEVTWGQGSKTMARNVGEWLSLLDELQLVGMRHAFQKLIKGLPMSRLCEIAKKLTAAAAASNRITSAGMVMAELTSL
eukprot:gene19026-25620_t